MFSTLKNVHIEFHQSHVDEEVGSTVHIGDR